jgi:hypothetical protein
VLLLELSGGGRALAADLHWNAPATCADAAALDREVSALLGKPLGLVESMSIDGVIREEGPGQYRLQLRMQARTPGAAETVREIQAADCQELLQAAALAIALAVTNGEAAPTAPARTAPVPATPDEAPPRAAAPVTPQASEPHIVIDAAALLDVGAFPQAAWGGEIELAWQQRWLRVMALAGWLPPQQQRLSNGAADADFALGFGAVSVCGRAQIGPLEAAACGGFELGQMSVHALGIDHPKPANTAWRALQTRLAVALPLGRHFAAMASLGLSLPLTRAEFVLDGQPAHQAAAVCLRSLLGLQIAL